MDPLNTSLYFDPFAMSPGMTDPTFASDFSPVSLFSPYYEDFSADFTSDSAGSPASPVSPVLSSGSFVVPTSDELGSWDNIDHSPEPDNFFKGPLPQFPVRTMTPAVNPMDLTLQPPVTGCPSDLRGPISQTSLFQTPQSVPEALPAVPSQQLSQPSPPAVTQASQQTRTTAKRNSTAGLKRKSSTSASEQDQVSPKRSSTSPSPAAQESPVPHKKTAHNMIEKRYRTNLNDKIAQLREAIPSLRSGGARFGKGNHEDEDGFDDDFASLVPVPKLNKATILSKATEYIIQLEARNRNLETENNAIRGRMEGLEMLMMSRGGASNTAGWN